MLVNFQAHRVRHSLSCVVLASLLVLFTGCGGDGKYVVTGTVSWNGSPVTTGHIILTPTDRSLRPDAGPIENGTFKFRATAGSKTVEIFADRPVGPVDQVMKIQAREQYIPVRYNEQTELTAEVNSQGENRLKFELVEEAGDQAAGADVARGLGK